MTSLVHIVTSAMSLRFLHKQPRYMQRNNIRSQVICSPSPLVDLFAREEQTVAHEIYMARQIKPRQDLKTLYMLWRRLLQIHPDIVHAHTPKAGLLGMIAAWFVRVPVRIYHIHGLISTATGIKRRILWLSDWLACRLANQVYCVSSSVKDIVIENKICPPSKITVINKGSINGVDAEGFFNPELYKSQRDIIRAALGIPDEALVIGFIGRIVRDKGIVELIESWKTLQTLYNNIHLVLVGPIEEGDPIPSNVKTYLEHSTHIHLVNQLVDFKKIPHYYAAIDLIILPSHREGFGLVAIEASAMALPVVATQIPGCVDSVMDDVTGTLVPVRNVEALTNAIRRYIDDPELRRHHGQAGRERVLRDFRPEDIWQALLAEYQRLLFEKGIIPRGADV